jgi:hypothetical protein
VVPFRSVREASCRRSSRRSSHHGDRRQSPGGFLDHAASVSTVAAAAFFPGLSWFPGLIATTAHAMTAHATNLVLS